MYYKWKIDGRVTEDFSPSEGTFYFYLDFTPSPIRVYDYTMLQEHETFWAVVKITMVITLFGETHSLTSLSCYFQCMFLHNSEVIKKKIKKI